MRDYGYNVVSPDEAAREIAQRNRYDYDKGTCIACGADVKPGNRTQHSNFHASYIHRSEVRDGFTVSLVKWCDVGDHAFKANAPGAQSIDVVQRDETGAEVRVVMDICHQHAFPTGIPTSPMAKVEMEYNRNRALPSAPINAVSAYPGHNED